MERPLIFVERLSTTVGRPLIFTGRLLKGWEQPFSESDIYVHRDFIILGRQMMYWNDMDTVYEVCGFEKWYVNVESLSLTSLSKLMGQRKQG